MWTGWLRPGVGTGLGEAWCKDCAGGRDEEGQKNIDFSREVLKFIKKSSDYRWEVLKIVKISSQKYWVYEHSQKKLLKSVGKMIETTLNPCVLRGSF